MSRTFVAGLAAAVIIAASPSAYAESATGARQAVAAAAAKALLERRIEVIKTALTLKPEQQKLWPAVEEAIRARAETRRARISKLVSLTEAKDPPNPIDALQGRADALAQKAAALKKLATAWQPLYATLDEGQKGRLAFLAAYAVREMRDAASRRLMAADDDDDDED